jgi:hypothetical protein
MRFDYLKPATDAVIDGLEDYEKIYALEQGEYVPLRTLPAENGTSAIYRCELTVEQRQMIADGADVLVEILHFGGPLAPSRVMLLNQQNFQEGESKQLLAEWFCAQTKGPYANHLTNLDVQE